MMRWSQIADFRRIIALALLFWAFADLAVPGWCKTDESAPVTTATDSDSSALDLKPDRDSEVCRVEKPAPAASHISLAQQPSDQEQGEDDCWCCCSHITPTPHFALARVEAIMPAEEMAELHCASGIPSLQYHPPRA